MARTMPDQHDVRYEAAIDWLKLVIAVVTAAALTVIYLLLPDPSGSSPLLEFVRACLPNLVSALIVFPAVFIVLGRVGLGAEDRLTRVIQQSMGTTAGGLQFSNDVGGTAEFIREIIAKKSTQRTIKIEIMAFTGGTFATAFLRDAIRLNPHKLNIVLRAIDFTQANIELFPGHWEREEADTVERLKVLCAGKADLEIWHYPSFPFLLGVAIDDSHLLITFPSWDQRTGKLADKSLEYRYFSRNSGSEYLFDLFENWARQPGQELHYAGQRDAP